MHLFLNRGVLFGEPYTLAMFGFFLVVMGAIGIDTGTVYGRGGSARRDEKPGEFWCSVSLYLVGGAVFLAWFVYYGYVQGYPPLW
jgi:hypothetical protein